MWVEVGLNVLLDLQLHGSYRELHRTDRLDSQGTFPRLPSNRLTQFSGQGTFGE